MSLRRPQCCLLKRKSQNKQTETDVCFKITDYQLLGPDIYVHTVYIVIVTGRINESLNTRLAQSLQRKKNSETNGPHVDIYCAFMVHVLP